MRDRFNESSKFFVPRKFHRWKIGRSRLSNGVISRSKEGPRERRRTKFPFLSPSFPFLSFRSMTESNGRIIIICADLKYRKRIGIQRSRLYGMVKERIRKIPAKYARSSVARVEDRWSGIGMRSALSRNKGMLSARTGIGDENKNALEIYTCMCGRKRIRFEDRQKETKRRTRWISQKDPYIYIYIEFIPRKSR